MIKLVTKRLTLKGNQAPTISSLVNAAISERHQHINVEKSPVGEHQNNDIVEPQKQKKLKKKGYFLTLQKLGIC